MNAVSRDVLLADVPLDRLAQAPSSFRQAKALADRGATGEARTTLEVLLTQQGLASRQRLQIWSALRELGATPDRALVEPLGVVVEVGMDDGLDLVAAYDDHNAAYVNYSGRSVIWCRPDASLDSPIDAVLDAAREIPRVLRPWTGPRRGPAARGQVRLNVVTPSGLYFGEGAHEDMARDPRGAPLLGAATTLMMRLIGLTPPKVVN